MNSKKPSNRFLALLLSLCMVLTMVPFTVFAASGTVAYIGDTGYDSLASAVEAASGGETIIMQEDEMCIRDRGQSAWNTLLSRFLYWYTCCPICCHFLRRRISDSRSYFFMTCSTDRKSVV